MSESSYHIKNLYKLSGLVAVVTGGGTGIGLMIARGLAENGAKVYITGRRKDVLEGVVNSGIIKGEVVALPMDVTVKASILEAKKVIEQKEGKLHILVNNAGQAGPMSLWFNDLTSPQHKDAETLGQALFTESEEGWADVFAINVYSIYFVTMAFLGLLDKGTKDQAGYTSSVINITSISAITKLAQQHFAYNTSKSAASHLTKMGIRIRDDQDRHQAGRCRCDGQRCPSSACSEGGNGGGDGGDSSIPGVTIWVLRHWARNSYRWRIPCSEPIKV